jgi:hypothetical protein
MLYLFSFIIRYPAAGASLGLMQEKANLNLRLCLGLHLVQPCIVVSNLF